MIGTIVKLFSGMVGAWNAWFQARERKAAEDTGAIKQREKSLEDESKALRDDRVRNSNADLQQRVQSDHGLEVGSDP